MLDIIIVNWNAGDQLRACLRSVAGLADVNRLVSRVVVVDNASTDSSADDLSFPDLSLVVIRNESNRGFAAACNQGASGSRANYLLFLNPDTQLFDESLSVSVRFMEDDRNARVGICGVKLVDEEGRIVRTCARFPSIRTILGNASGLGRFFPKIFPPHFMLEWDHAMTRTVDQVMGAFFLVRRSLFEELRGFDERFFVYYEEVDFSYRAAKLGYESRFLADTQVYHKGGGTSEQVKSTRLYYSLRSRIMYGHKHFPAPVASSLAAVTLILEPVARLVERIAERDGQGIAETWGAFRRLWAEAPALLTGRAKRLSL